MTTTAPAVRSFDKLFVGGRWVEPASSNVIDVVSPVTEEHLATVPEASAADVDAAVAAARKAFDEGPWPRMSPAERGEVLRRIGAEVQKRIPEMVASFTAEIGAPSIISQAFHGNATAMWDDAATLHERVAFEERRDWDGGSALIVREPVGVVGTIIPWNGPVATASLKLSPALAAGCPVVLKPAPEGPVSTLILAEALEAAGLPEGVVSVLPAGREVGEHLVTHPGVDKVSFTGSTAAGRRVMSLCGDRIARVTLELGGKSAGIVCDDIPLDRVLGSLLPAGFGHSGQVCAAITRILVSRKRHDELVEAAAGVLSSLKVGDPCEEGTVIGPLAAERQRDRVEGYIRAGIDEGATLVTGGGRPQGIDRGWYVEPTLFANADNSMRIAQEEIFGPVLTVIPYDDVEHAIRIANDSEYGLSGAVYTDDRELGEHVARRVRTGQIFVNDASMCVTQPFGGFKQSGLGREGGVEGIEPYLETKMIQGV
ncbi:aldehyde dehydrogenase [Pseudonocardia endophytica]|uniref:aldehyde dehydrogenase (NAD(+)) n=1 Tax=Pseudonocardia endophytica TaxID=401976 RepID=A0A4R1HJA7_PSEEN|nr:aldehyde dehydrogenase [Pseudonocardia endophytica]TCK22424.1 acyl-CoA reductase-like NAD-dependent aldehyde dehydrogenase [Pseudonocardia endophytica]